MKTRLLSTVAIVIALAFLVSTPAVAGDNSAVKEEFEGTFCRYAKTSGTTITLPSDRVVRKDGWALWDITSTDERVAGVFESYDVSFNLSPKEPIDGPKTGSARTGAVHANFILTPYDSEIMGTFEGSWRGRYTIEEGWRYWAMTVNGHGTGDLEGLKIRVDVKYLIFDADCTDLDPQYPNLFSGYVLDPNAQNE
jgi:hypothetical protein